MDSMVEMSTDCACSRAAAWRSASSATSITSFSWYAATADANAHASSSACLEPMMMRAFWLTTRSASRILFSFLAYTTASVAIMNTVASSGC
jgi:hypothetical protein